MLHCYSLQKGTYSDEEGIDHAVYGVCATDVCGNVLESYPDIFFDEQKAERFVDLCNESELSLCHLQDVIEDLFDGSGA